MKRFAGLAALALAATMGHASEDIADQYPQSELYSKPVEVIPHVFSAIGATAPPTYENSGHNNNLSFIVTDEGVVVVNGGASARLAAALHKEIKAVTDQPVVLVINKVDLLSDEVRSRIRQELVDRLAWEGPVFEVSAATGEGTESLAQAVMRALEDQSQTGD